MPSPFPKRSIDSLMLSSIRGTFRRTVAVLLVLGFGMFTAETLIADVHDGDVGAAVAGLVESTAPHSHDVPDQPTGDAGHSMHVCHCAHSHAGPPVLASSFAERLVNANAPLVSPDRLPRSAGRDLQLRPPIA